MKVKKAVSGGGPAGGLSCGSLWTLSSTTLTEDPNAACAINVPLALPRNSPHGVHILGYGES